MSTPQSVILNYDASKRKFFGSGGGWFDLVPQDYLVVVLQATKTSRVNFDTDGLAPTDSDINYDLSGYTSLLTTLKTFPNWTSGGDFAACVAGMLTSDTRHDPSKGRVVSALVTPKDFAPRLYRASMLLQTSGGNRWDVAPINCRVTKESVEGSEASIPSSLTQFLPGTVDGIVSIAAADSKTKTTLVTNLTASSVTGRVVVTQLAPTGNTGPAIYSVSIQTGQIVITTTANPLNGGMFNFYYQVVRL